jgi:hypothetical protein
MKGLAWAVWTSALVYNVYGTWVLGGGLIRIFAIGPALDLRSLRTDALMAGPIITLIAMLWSLTWRTKNGSSN